jgi:hypothetical protein
VAQNPLVTWYVSTMEIASVGHATMQLQQLKQM